MKINDWDYVGRSPRHQAATQVEIERAGNASPTHIMADLVDFSRQGARLRAEPGLAENEPIVILLRNPSIGLDLAFPGAVRWCGQHVGSRRMYGCQFKEEVPLETLGELFLAGILSVQPTASSG
ncbi:MAG TPA: PilZ domain-containing protein [Pirellulales bacterium]|nr:PilZ domain-containing protein [Pirellulales bacterium]